LKPTKVSITDNKKSSVGKSSLVSDTITDEAGDDDENDSASEAFQDDENDSDFEDSVGRKANATSANSGKKDRKRNGESDRRNDGVDDVINVARNNIR
jgi:hypothetical protein